MTIEQTQYLIRLLNDKGVLFDNGLTDGGILQVEAKFNFRFPPDLKLFLQTALPVSGNFINWRLGLTSKNETENITSRLEWPLEGMLFDIESNNFWVDAWGIRPENYNEQALIARKHYETYPKLIPIYSHRYIPSRPNDNGNPVFSVHQMDIIYYGYDLATYLSNEFDFTLTAGFELLDKPKKEIAFWSEWAE